VARFRREARHAAKLSHNNVARVWHYSANPRPDGVLDPYLVMEYVPGRSLSALFADEGPLDERPSFEFRPRSPTGSPPYTLAGLVHRDVKQGAVDPGDPVGERSQGLPAPAGPESAA
jgi:eukaryotic-like serine/threonine-protein kinase